MKRTALSRKTPLRRKAPLRSAKPKAGTKTATKPLRKKRPTVAQAQTEQRRIVTERSRGRCEMEVAGRFLFMRTWDRCKTQAQDLAHVFTRPKNGKARDLPDAVIHACRACHEASEGKLGVNGVRVPLERAQAAWWLILHHSKLGTSAEDRLRIHIGSVGELPEKGVPPY